MSQGSQMTLTQGGSSGIHSNIEILLKRLDWISQNSLRYELKSILVQASSHAFLPISGMLTQLLALDWLYNETLTFKRSNQIGRLNLFIFHLLLLLLRIYIQVLIQVLIVNTYFDVF